MAGEWHELILGDLGRVVTGKTPLTSIKENFGGHIPFVTPSDMDERKTISKTVRYLTESGAASVKGSKISAGSVMVSCIGSDMGKVAIAGHDCVTNQQINSVVVDNRFSSEFLYYSLKIRKDELRSRASGGSTLPILNKSDFSRLDVWLPPLPEQRAIAAVLGTLDDLIELNRETNEILEEMARALFKSWFVDFDPVRAKLEGRPPAGMDATTAALFPDHFQDSELGQIPKGWDVRPVGGVVSCVGGGTPSTSEPKFWENGAHHWTTPKDFSSLRSPFLIGTDRRIADAGLAKISSGLLPVGTVLMSSRAPVGYLAIADIPVAINQGFIAMRPNELVSNYYLLNWCQSNMIEIESRASGTTFAEISKSAFRPIPMVVPSARVMDAFTKFVDPLYSQIALGLHESRDLAVLRDYLLPKLLSGEIQTQ